MRQAPSAFGLMAHGLGTGLGVLLVAVLGYIFGVPAWRLLAEFMLVLFGIHDRLGELRLAFRQHDAT